MTKLLNQPRLDKPAQTSVNQQYLLDDAAVVKFIIDGYMFLQTDFPDDF